MTNLVFGGAGLIGKRLCEQLREKGEAVVPYDLRTYWDLRYNVPPENSVEDRYCWFLAWDVGGAKYIMNPDNEQGILKSNLRLCQNVFEWLERSKVPFTFTSTQMVGYPNAYGATKAVGEGWTKSLSGGLIARLWNVYDAEEPSDRSHVIPDLIAQSKSGVIQMMTSGQERRQWLLADDCAEGLIHQRGTRQPTADITTGEWVSVRVVADTIGGLTGAKVCPGESVGHQNMIPVSSPLLGWEPQVDLEFGISIVVDRMRKSGWA